MNNNEKLLNLMTMLSETDETLMIGFPGKDEDFLVVRHENIISIESIGSSIRVVHKEMNKVRETILEKNS